MMGLFSKFIRSRDHPIESVEQVTSVENSVSMAMGFGFGGSLSGKGVSPRSAVQLSTVYACVRVIAETVASLPLHLERTMDGSGSEHAVEHPLYRILHDQPNDEMTSFSWRETMMTHLLLWGNSYNQLVYNNRGEVAAIYPLLPENMQVSRDKDRRIVYTYTNESGQHILAPEQVLHIPGLGFDGLVGYSPIAMERNALGLTMAAEEYGNKFFANGARPSGVLKHPGKVRDPKKLREAWREAYGGSGNAGGTAVLEEGMEYQQISMPNSEAQFIELRRFQTEEICRIYRVPPHMVGDLSHATYSNIEHQSIGFGQYTINPWCVRIEQSLKRRVVAEKDRKKYYAHFNLDGIMRGDYKSRMEGYAIARHNGWFSANDIHRLEGLPLIPAEKGGDIYAVNGNMIALENLKNNKPKQNSEKEENTK